MQKQTRGSRLPVLLALAATGQQPPTAPRDYPASSLGHTDSRAESQEDVELQRPSNGNNSDG